MNKKIIGAIAFSIFLAIASPIVNAVKIENPLEAGGVNDLPTLFTRIAKGVGDLMVAMGGVMIVIAGFLFMTSAGSPEKINKAKTALTYAIIGMIIGLVAKGIANTVRSIVGA